MKRMLLVAGVFGIAYAAVPSLGFSNAEALLSPPQRVPFKITQDNGTSQNRLIIPRQFLEDRTAFNFRGHDPGTDLRTVIAGLAISASVVCLVFLILRKKSRAAQAMALCIALGGAGLLWVERASADLPPPTADVVRQWRQVNKDQQNVIIEIADKGDAVELVLGTKYRGSGGQRSSPSNPNPN